MKTLLAIGKLVPIELTGLIWDLEKDHSPEDLESLELYLSLI